MAFEGAQCVAPKAKRAFFAVSTGCIVHTTQASTIDCVTVADRILVDVAAAGASLTLACRAVYKEPVFTQFT